MQSNPPSPWSLPSNGPRSKTRQTVCLRSIIVPLGTDSQAAMPRQPMAPNAWIRRQQLMKGRISNKATHLTFKIRWKSYDYHMKRWKSDEIRCIWQSDESQMGKNHLTSSDCHMTCHSSDEKKVRCLNIFYYTGCFQKVWWKSYEYDTSYDYHIHLTKSDEKSYDFFCIWHNPMKSHMIFLASDIIRWKVIWFFIHLTKSDEKSDIYRCDYSYYSNTRVVRSIHVGSCRHSG